MPHYGKMALIIIALILNGFSASWATPAGGHTAWTAITSKHDITVGDTGYATLDAILAGTPAARTTIIVPSGTHNLSASNNRTVPAGVTLKVLSGGNIVISSGHTLTIKGPIAAGRYQIFTDRSGSTSYGVKFTGSLRPRLVFPEWWGANPAVNHETTLTATTAAFNCAVWSLSPVGGVVQCDVAEYHLNGPIIMPVSDGSICLEGVSAAKPWWYSSGTTIAMDGDYPTVILNTRTSITHITFMSRLTYASVLYGPGNCTFVTIENNHFMDGTSPWSYCIQGENLHIARINNNTTYQTGSFLGGYVYDSEIRGNRVAGAVGMPNNVWTQNTDVPPGTIISPSNSQLSQSSYAFQAAQASTGTTAATEPTQWPNVFEGYGIVMWQFKRTKVTQSGTTYRYEKNALPVTVTVVDNGSDDHHYHRTTGSWVTDGYTNQQKNGENKVYVTGFGTGNDGLKSVTRATAADLWVSDTLITNGTPTSAVFSEGSWLNEGFATTSPKRYICVNGYSHSENNGLKTVTAVTDRLLTVTEATVAEDPPTYFGTWFSPTIADGGVTWAAVYPCMGLNIHGGTSIIESNDFEGFWAGISSGISDNCGQVGGLAACCIVANHFQQNRYAIFIGGAGGTGYSGSIVGNNLVGMVPCGYTGIWMDRSIDMVVTGNWIGTWVGYGIYLSGGDRCIIGPNSFYSNTLGNIYNASTNKPEDTVTLRAGYTTTVVSNTLVNANSRITLTPTSANAAADQGSATGVWVSAKTAGTSFTITHPNNANADKTFDYQITN